MWFASTFLGDATAVMEIAMQGPEVLSSAVFGYGFALFVVALCALLAGIRLGVQTRSPPRTQSEELAHAMNVLRRHLEAQALEEMKIAGAQLWTPDPERVAALSYGVSAGAERS